MVQPCSTAIAACWASATSFPVAPELPASSTEPSFVFLRVESSWSVEDDSRAGPDAAHGDQSEGRRLRHLATLQRIVQSPCYEGAHAEAAGFGLAAHLFGKPVVKGNRRSHDAVE